MRRLAERTGFPLAVLLAVGIGVGLRSDVLAATFFADDFDHYAMQVGAYPVPRSRFDMFNFGDGTPAETQRLIDSGHFPWWSDPGVHLAMLRPLCSALIAFDFATFGLQPRYFYLHSFAWWAALVIAAALVLGRMLPKPIAALAVLLFAIEEGHSLPVGWLANRSTLVATAFAFFALHAHVRFRQSGSVRARIASILLCMLAVSAGEYSFSAFAYFAAYELFFTNGPDKWRRRALGLLPCGLVAVAYLMVRSALGYGIAASGFYLSPTAAPLTFVAALAWRVPVLVAELAFGIPADWYTSGSPWRERILLLDLFSPQAWAAMPGWPAWHVILGVCSLLAVFASLWRFRAVFGFALARPLLCLACGALLSLAPVSGGMVSARLTVAGSLGFDAAIAALLFASFIGVRARPSFFGRMGCLLACAVLLWMHVGTAAARSRWEAQWIRHRSYVESHWVLAAEIDEALIAKQQVLVVSAQDLATAWYLPYIRNMARRPMPRSYLLLSGASQPHDLHRLADNVLELVVLTRNVELMATGSNYRPADKPFHPGDTVMFAGIRAQVQRVLFGQPQSVRFTFPASVDDPRYLFLFSTQRGLRKLTMPAVGERLRLMRPVYPYPDALQAQAQDRAAERERVKQTAAPAQ